MFSKKDFIFERFRKMIPFVGLSVYAFGGVSMASIGLIDENYTGENLFRQYQGLVDLSKPLPNTERMIRPDGGEFESGDDDDTQGISLRLKTPQEAPLASRSGLHTRQRRRSFKNHQEAPLASRNGHHTRQRRRSQSETNLPNNRYVQGQQVRTRKTRSHFRSNKP